jgi:hypothetical protein
MPITNGVALEHETNSNANDLHCLTNYPTKGLHDGSNAAFGGPDLAFYGVDVAPRWGSGAETWPNNRELWATRNPRRGWRNVSQDVTPLKILLSLIIVSLLVVGGSILRWSRQEHFPSHWAAEVEPLAGFVEQVRGSRFKHPVEVAFLPPAEFDRQILSMSNAPTTWTPVSGGDDFRGFGCSNDPRMAWGRCLIRGEHVDPEAKAGELLGLVTDGSKTDVELADITEGDIVGLYISSKHRVIVRGAFNVSIGPVLVHELTHAWQDQKFSLQLQDAKDGDHRLAIRSIFEGDATRVESNFRDSLSSTALAAVKSDEEKQYLAWDGKEAKRSIRANSGDRSVTDDDTRAYELSRLTFPYTYGADYVSRLAARGGEAAVNAAFQRPPSSSHEILHPDLGEQPPALSFPIGTTHLVWGPSYVHGAMRLGENNLALMLSRVTDSATAFDLASAWKNDAIEVFQSGEDICATLFLDADLGSPKGAALALTLLEWSEVNGARINWDEFQNLSISRCAAAPLNGEPPITVRGMHIIAAPYYAAKQSTPGELGGW